MASHMNVLVIGLPAMEVIALWADGNSSDAEGPGANIDCQ